MIIAVIGNFDPPAHVYALAEQVGKELARRGITVVCGGLTTTATASSWNGTCPLNPPHSARLDRPPKGPGFGNAATPISR